MKTCQTCKHFIGGEDLCCYFEYQPDPIDGKTRDITYPSDIRGLGGLRQGTRIEARLMRYIGPCGYGGVLWIEK